MKLHKQPTHAQAIYNAAKMGRKLDPLSERILTKAYELLRPKYRGPGRRKEVRK